MRMVFTMPTAEMASTMSTMMNDVFDLLLRTAR